MGLVEKYAIEDKIVHSKSVGEYNFRLQPKRWLYFLQMYTMQLLSAIFIDLFLVLKGKKARFVHTFKLIMNINFATHI